MTSATDELAESLAELRELARGLHPAALEHGSPSALESLAVALDGADGGRPATSPSVSPARRARALLRRLRGAGKRRQVRASDRRVFACLAQRDRRRHRDRRRRRRRSRRHCWLGPAGANRSRRSTGRARARHKPARRGNRHHRRDPVRGSALRTVHEQLPPRSCPLYDPPRLFKIDALEPKRTGIIIRVSGIESLLRRRRCLQVGFSDPTGRAEFICARQCLSLVGARATPRRDRPSGRDEPQEAGRAEAAGRVLNPHAPGSPRR